jgi:AraC-like DNA-binding protein
LAGEPAADPDTQTAPWLFLPFGLASAVAIGYAMITVVDELSRTGVPLGSLSLLVTAAFVPATLGIVWVPLVDTVGAIQKAHGALLHVPLDSCKYCTEGAGMATDRGPADAGLELLNYSFLTDELDHAVEFVTRNFGDHSRVARGRGPLGYRISAAISGRGTSGVAACALPTTVRAVTRSITAHLPLHHGNEYRVGRRTLRSGPDVAVLLCPGHDYTVLTAPGEALVFMLEPSLLEREIEALRMRRPGGWTLRSMSLSLTPANVAILRGLVTRHGAAVAAARLTRRADELWALEDQVAGWLARQVMAADGLVTLSPSNREIVRRIDGWIRQHMSQPITLERLRVAAGVSARTLQEACLAHWSQTPLELVAARRLEAARSMLQTGTAPNVTEAAVRSGFSHLGRFSVNYRRAFGESPSDTLARASTAPVSRRRVVGKDGKPLLGGPSQ